MKTDNIRIKRKNSDFLLYGFLYLLLILVGIFLVGLPFLSFAPNGNGSRIFLIVLGVLCVGAGGTLYGMLLYRGLCPQDALIITNKGLTDHLVGGRDGVYIEWTNVSSMKIYGLSKSPMLGLSLEDNESYLSNLSGRNERDARANLEVGLPIVSIAQRDIFLPIGELKNLFSRMIKGAISWETYSTQGKNSAQTTAPQSTQPENPQPENLQPENPQSSDEFQPIHPHVEQPQAQTPKEASKPEVLPTESPSEESFLLETLSDNESPAPPEPPAKPTNPETNETQEEIVLLDIDND